MNTDQTEALRKVEQYTKVKRTGFKLLAGGVAATISGVVLISNVEIDPITGQIVSGETGFLLGLYGIIYAGMPLLATGTTLAIIGNYKEKSYLNKFDRVSVSYFNQYGANGFRLTYSF